MSGRAKNCKNSLDFGLSSPYFKQKVVFSAKSGLFRQKWAFSGRKMAHAEDKNGLR